ncbi:hypothetical protein MAR_034389 [Mya arenaria]|uniref:Uncharacterized protein n=1 Tax=Mya arenaria TaxID=6604 RepID=A0ABY7GD64_MYAAR|nr:hypothetical protein MAR_034389 [Mya arenaria]
MSIKQDQDIRSADLLHSSRRFLCVVKHKRLCNQPTNDNESNAYNGIKSVLCCQWRTATDPVKTRDSSSYNCGYRRGVQSEGCNLILLRYMFLEV